MPRGRVGDLLWSSCDCAISLSSGYKSQAWMKCFPKKATFASVPAVGLDHNDPISCLAAGVTRLFMHPEQAGGDLVPRQEFHPGRPLASAQSLTWRWPTIPLF